MVSKTDDGLLYTLRHCDTGKSLRSAVHANRIKLFESDRDILYNRHNIKQANTSQALPPNPPIPPTDTTDASNDVWYVIDRLLDHKKSGKKTLYLVKWEDKSRSWEPAENVTDFAINEYHIRREQRKKRKQRRH